MTRPRIIPLEAAERIVMAVAEAYGVSVADIVGRRRHRAHADPRQAAMHALVSDGRWSLARIGRWLDGRDHATVFCGARRHAERMETANE